MRFFSIRLLRRWLKRDNTPLPETGLAYYQARLKRFFDILAAVFAVIILSPTLLLVAAAIKLDSRGPVLRRHVRHGYGKEIQVLKFRFNEVTGSGRYSFNLTRVGRASASGRIEDLPQLINVLSGEMSIVGPEPFASVPRMIEDQLQQHPRAADVKPGLTGWAQINGCRGDPKTYSSLERRVAHDLYYAEHCSFLLDIRIIAMTIFSKAVYAAALS